MGEEACEERKLFEHKKRRGFVKVVHSISERMDDLGKEGELPQQEIHRYMADKHEIDPKEMEELHTPEAWQTKYSMSA